MDDRASLHLPLLVNALGHLSGVVVFAAFLVLLHRGSRRAQPGALRATEAAALLALLWNAGSLAVLALGSLGAPGETVTAALSFSALSLLPGVLLHLSLGEGRRVLRGLGYALSFAAVCLHIGEAAGLRSGLHAPASFRVAAASRSTDCSDSQPWARSRRIRGSRVLPQSGVGILEVH